MGAKWTVSNQQDLVLFAPKRVRYQSTILPKLGGRLLLSLIQCPEAGHSTHLV